jgi:predicted kinase
VYLDAREEGEVLADGQQLEQRVVLRAVADAPPDRGLLRADAQALDVRLAAGLADVPREHLQRRGLARAVDAEEAEALAWPRGDTLSFNHRRWRSFLRDLHTNRAAIAVTFCQNDSAAPG